MPISGFVDLPEPFTPADCDLRSFPFMALDVVRLRDSDVAALEDPEAFRAAVLLWCSAWHQLPAGSLPDDDKALCRLAGYGRDGGATWKRARDGGALRGFIKCSDGRLYHPVICEKARAAWAQKERNRDRTEAARQHLAGRRAAADHKPESKEPGQPLSVTDPVTTSVTDKSQSLSSVCNSIQRRGEEKKGEETIEEETKDSVAPLGFGYVAVNGNDHLVSRDLVGANVVPLAAVGPTERPFDNRFEEFWRAYPKKVGKDDARKAWAKALKRAPADEIIRAVRDQVWAENPKYDPHPAKWLNGGRWQDDPNPHVIAKVVPTFFGTTLEAETSVASDDVKRACKPRPYAIAEVILAEPDDEWGGPNHDQEVKRTRTEGKFDFAAEILRNAEPEWPGTPYNRRET